MLPGLRVVPIYNAIDLQRFSPAGSQIGPGRARRARARGAWNRTSRIDRDFRALEGAQGFPGGAGASARRHAGSWVHHRRPHLSNRWQPVV